MNNITTFFARPLIALNMWKPEGEFLGPKLFGIYWMLIAVGCIFFAFFLAQMPVSFVFPVFFMNCGSFLIGILFLFMPIIIFLSEGIPKKFTVSDFVSLLVIIIFGLLVAFLAYVISFKDFMIDDKFGMAREEKVVELEYTLLDPIYTANGGFMLFSYDVKIKNENQVYNSGILDPYTKELREKGAGLYRVTYLPYSKVILKAEKIE